MRSIVSILIIIVIVISTSFLQEIQIRQKFVHSELIELDYILPYISQNCLYSNRYFYFEIPDCYLYTATPALKLIGTPVHTSDGSIFDQKRLMVKSIELKSDSGYSLNRWSGVISAAVFRVRVAVYQLVIESVSPVQAGLLLAMLLGNKEWLISSTRPYFENTGTLHILATSGTHVSVVLGILSQLVSKLSYRLRGGLLLVGIVWYLIFLGSTPSISRAVVMAAMTLSAKYFLHRRVSHLYCLVLSGGLLLAWRPEWLFAIGFQLSFLSSLGIIVALPILTRVIHSFSGDYFRYSPHLLVEKRHSIGLYMLEQSLVGFSAQLFILPVLVSNFAVVPVLGFLATVCIGWFVPYLIQSMFWGLVTLLLFKFLLHMDQVSSLASFFLIWTPATFFLSLMKVLSTLDWGNWKPGV